MSSIDMLKEQKRSIIRRHAQSDNLKGLAQVLVTLVCLVILWWAAVLTVAVSYGLTIVAVLLISLFSLRVFALISPGDHRVCPVSLFRLLALL